MRIDRHPASVRTLYAELLDQLVAAAAEAAAGEAPPSGSFVRKTVNGHTYWYLQRSQGEQKRQHYLGPDSEELRRWIERQQRAKKVRGADADRRTELVRMLAAGGARRTDAAVARVLELLGEWGVFRLGAVLVGTHAVGIYGAMLGVRFPTAALRTEDIDIAQDSAIGIALAPDAGTVAVGERLIGSGLGFHALPGLRRTAPPTSFKIRGRSLRVDFLTPARSRDDGRPVQLPTLQVAAEPVRHLGYLLENPAQGVVIAGSGVLVTVPDPSRFALHKLAVSTQRPVTFEAKAEKDRIQASALLTTLLEDRPEDLAAAWREIQDRPALAKQTQRGKERLDERLRRELDRAG